jgi:RNA 2',3'-cyclic 3'-phosphodiesterase
MEERGRGFVAVVPPPSVLDAVEKATAAVELPGAARRTTRAQRHLTLQFLGNAVPFDAVAAALGALTAEPGGVRLGGGGAFPRARRGRVLWLGVVDGSALLARLGAAVAACVAPLGFEPEDRRYHPHLTLARLPEPGDLRRAVAALGSEPVGAPFPVEDVVLFRSRTRAIGAEYEERARVVLAR